jgi:hypothetical protein
MAFAAVELAVRRSGHHRDQRLAFLDALPLPMFFAAWAAGSEA